ncbi:DUF4432 family protein [Rhizobium sp. SG2393]|uniref:DUF4432 family protein n=1 Tax=Rhizobium sp. SG2393 TaxID=3276279 RepID=UPI00366FA45D
MDGESTQSRAGGRETGERASRPEAVKAVETSGTSANHVLLDRQSGLDIAAFVVDGVDLAPGVAIPAGEEPRIARLLQGFLFTCGPDHIRLPEPRESGDGNYPLHGSLPGTQVVATSIETGPDGPVCHAQTVVSLADGGQATVARRIYTAIDGYVTIEDRLTNTGTTPFSPMWMYHLNLGAWLFDDETWIEAPVFGEGALFWRFGDGERAHLCLDTRPTLADTGLVTVTLGPLAMLGGRTLSIRFPAACLPWLQFWRSERNGGNVFSIEPASHRLASRAELAENGELVSLAPGESRSFGIAFRMV